MKNKNTINNILKLLAEETRKLKKKKFTPVSISPLRRPMGSMFYMDAGVSMSESEKTGDLSNLRQQVNSSNDVDEFLRNIITDYDIRYKNRKAAQPLVKKQRIEFLDRIKPLQKIDSKIVNDWKEAIKIGKRPFVIIRSNNSMDGYHKFEAYKILGFKEVPVLFEKDLISFYNSNKANATSLNESSIIKPITKKFNHLKWKLNDFQKQFLDDFINIPGEALKDKDFEYASKRTGIPIESIKSIRNTYGSPEYGYAKPDIVGGSVFNALHKGPTAKELGLTGKELPTQISGKLFPMNQNPEFRAKTPGETIYKAKHGNTGGLHRNYERELPNFMYEWLLYFIEGSDKFSITESKLMNELNSTLFDKLKFILFSIDIPLKESNAHAYDMASHNELVELKEFYKKIKEFNDTFGTNFVVSNQFTGEDGLVKIVLENAQTTDGRSVFNRKLVDMSMTDEKREVVFAMQKSIYG